MSDDLEIYHMLIKVCDQAVRRWHRTHLACRPHEQPSDAWTVKKVRRLLQSLLASHKEDALEAVLRLGGMQALGVLADQRIDEIGMLG